MKKMDIALEDKELYIGNGREIKNLFNNLEKHFVAFSMFEKEPKFNLIRNYGLLISYDVKVDEYPVITILNANDIIDIILYCWKGVIICGF